jgi:hypothetical protein
VAAIQPKLWITQKPAFEQQRSVAVNTDLATLLGSQNHVVRRDQLLAAGMTVAEIRTQLRSGRWSAYGVVVIAAHNGPLDRGQQCWAAVLSAGKGAVLAGLTALEASNLRNWTSPQVHVLVPRATGRAQLPGLAVVVHETRHPAGPAPQTSGFPCRTSVERAAIDAASWRSDARSGYALLASVVQQRLTTADRLSIELAAAGPIRHRRPMRLAIGDIAGGAEALSEIDFGRLCRKYHLGTLVRQQVRLDGQGRRRYLDGEIVSPTGKRVAFEVDGGVHLLPISYWADMRRQNELFIAKTSLLRFSSYAMRFQSDIVVDQLRRALAD